MVFWAMGGDHRRRRVLESWRQTPIRPFTFLSGREAPLPACLVSMITYGFLTRRNVVHRIAPQFCRHAASTCERTTVLVVCRKLLRYRLFRDVFVEWNGKCLRCDALRYGIVETRHNTEWVWGRYGEAQLADILTL